MKIYKVSHLSKISMNDIIILLYIQGMIYFVDHIFWTGFSRLAFSRKAQIPKAKDIYNYLVTQEYTEIM